jgi:hypothetical protein
MIPLMSGQSRRIARNHLIHFIFPLACSFGQIVE